MIIKEIRNDLASEIINNILNGSTLGLGNLEESEDNSKGGGDSKDGERLTFNGFNGFKDNRETLTNQEVHGPVSSSGNGTNRGGCVDWGKFGSHQPRDGPDTNRKRKDITKDGNE
jgi:hypothetical protein